MCPRLSLSAKVILIFSCIIQMKTLADMSKRPFYNLAHMSNSKEDLNKALEQGANGIEFDVRFNEEGRPITVYHGYVCDCFRKCDDFINFVDYIKYMRELTTPDSDSYNSNFTFAFVDLKTNTFNTAELRRTAGQKLFDSLAEHLFNFGKIKTKIKLLLSVLVTFDEDFIIGFMEQMKKNKLEVINDYIGWDVSNGEALGAIRFMYQKLLKVYKLNIWQSDGISNCLSLLVPRDRVNSAIQIRDSVKPFMSKVCYWTIDLKSHMRQSLRMGVDSILTNVPARLITVIKEKEFIDKYRLATNDDNPWVRFEDKQNKKPNNRKDTPKKSLSAKVLKSKKSKVKH